MEEASDLLGEAQQRTLSLLDFLEAIHRREYPPVRDIAKYTDFLVWNQNLPAVPGVELTPGGSRWLTLKLIARPTMPRLPADLSEYVEEDKISANVEPIVRQDVSDTDELAIVQEILDEWITNEWEPWSEKCKQIEKGRAFYKAAFDLRTRVERDREAFELVWGFGRLQWARESQNIDHPLLTVPIEIDHDRADGSLSFVPTGTVSVEYAFLADLPISDRAGYLDRRRSAEEIELDPWNAETIQGAYEGLLRAIDLDGTICEAPESSRGRRAMLSDSWVIYMRRRQADYLGFLEAQRQILLNNPDVIPLPIASLVVDEPSRLIDNDHARGEEEDTELLLPLPANEEQLAILKKASRRGGVTVQGPPGTGKTHTIANLISHFVAHGQRVLVVAEKEQAIKVVAEKVPDGIRALVVSNLGSDVEARTRLQQSITSIQTGVFNVTTVPTVKELERRQVALNQISSLIALYSSELRERSMSESSPCPTSITAAGRSTPSEVASWLQEHVDTLGYIPDRLQVSELCPITSDELQELASGVRDIDPADLEEARQLLPPLGLPSSSELAQSDRENDQIDAELAAGPIFDWLAVDAAEPEYLNQLAQELSGLWSWFSECSGSWLARVRDELSDPGYFRAWSDFTITIRNERDRAFALAKSLVTCSVILPDVLNDPHAFRSTLESARIRFETGKTVGLWNKNVREVLDCCRVNGIRPTNTHTIKLCIEELDLRETRHRLAIAWINQTRRVGAPALESATPEHELGNLITELEWLIAWNTTHWPKLRQTLAQLGIATPQVASEDDIARLHQATSLFAVRLRKKTLIRERSVLADFLAQQAQQYTASPLWANLNEALASSDWDRWDLAKERCQRLHSFHDRAERVGEIIARLADRAPLWAGRIIEYRDIGTEDPASLADAWQWRCAETWIANLNDRRSMADLERLLEDMNQQRLRSVEELVVGRAWRNLADKFTDRHRIALQQYVTASKRLGRGYSKYAARFQREVRHALNDAKDAVPVWIMTISKALESFRPAPTPPFDVLIVDEASQIGLEAIPILGLARRAIIVGDDKQTSPENVGLNRGAIFELIDEHLCDIPKYRTLFDPDTSLYDLAAIKFPDIVMLREHFRCLPEIISYSNNRYYDGKIEALRDRRPSQGWSPTGTVYVKIGFRKSNLDTNEAEAVAIVNLIEELIKRPDYVGMTFGVISMLGTKQATHIQELLLDRLGSCVMEDRHIRCGDATQFQGDERDIILLSLVVGPDESGQLGRVKAMTSQSDERRMNVAASRAINQLWVVHSIPPEDFPNQDPRAELIRHCLEPARIDDMSDRLLDKCESEFERRVVRDILVRGFRHVRVQYVAGNYRIDIVVEGPQGRRLAVECDGDAWHGIDRWDQDRARQTVLERAGWRFERIAGSAYWRDPARALEPLWSRLEELNIPTGEWQEVLNAAPPQRIIDQLPNLEREFGMDEAETVVEAMGETEIKNRHESVPVL